MGWATAYAWKSYSNAITRTPPIKPLSESEIFSPAFVYNQIKFPNGGACLPDALQLLRNQGAVALSDMPYKEFDSDSQPDEVTKRKALKHRIAFWRKLDPGQISEIKAQLSSGFPVLVGMEVDYTFEAARQGFVWRNLTAKSGSHALLTVGYDDAKHAFKVLNSWGTEWGDSGFGWIDYDLFGVVAREAYIVKDSEKTSFDQVVQNNDEGNPADDRPNDLNFTITGGNQVFPGQPFTIQGQWQVPVGLGDSVQLALYVVETDGQFGAPIRRFRSLDVEYSDVHGYVVFASPKYDVPKRGRRAGMWEIQLVPDRIAWPTGRQYWYNVRLVMFVDGFGFDQQGNPLPK